MGAIGSVPRWARDINKTVVFSPLLAFGISSVIITDPYKRW
jgi:hypothetical protein